MKKPLNNPTENLSRQLGLFDSSMIMMGIVIGSGIFVTTGIMADNLPSPALILLAWIFGGLLTLAGALTYAELGTSFPESGGQYVYLREAYGDLAGFLFGWVLFLIYMTGGIAALALAFTEYMGRFITAIGPETILLKVNFHPLVFSFNYKLSSGQLGAACLIFLLSFVNYMGIRWGKAVQNVFTLLKIATLLIIVFLGFFFQPQTSFHLPFNPDKASLTELLSGFGLALIAVTWAFDGWNNVNFVSGEIKKPQKTLPCALISGAAGITILYFLINLVYFRALNLNEMKGVVRIAEKASTSLFGPIASSFIAIAILISIFGSLNGSILSGPRVYYAMARDKLFFRKAGLIHRQYKTPGFSIILQAVWASLLALSGTFQQVLTFSMFMAIAFWIAAAASVFTLRKKRPSLLRPYKVWGYPVIPALFILASMGILINTVIERTLESLAGLTITLFGIPAYLFWKRKAGFDKKTNRFKENENIQ